MALETLLRAYKQQQVAVLPPVTTEELRGLPEATLALLARNSVDVARATIEKTLALAEQYQTVLSAKRSEP